MKDRDLWIVGALWIALSLVCLGLVEYTIATWPTIAAEEGEITAEAVFFIYRVSAVIFALVVVLIVYPAVRFRVAEDDLTDSAHQWRYGRLWAWGWVLVSAVLNILFIAHPGISGLQALWGSARAAENPVVVNVSAQQWEWRFTYPQFGIEQNEALVLPAGRAVRLVLDSEDVIHSFWVPGFGLKKAVIPGESRTLQVTPDRVVSTSEDPVVRVQCAQICGIGHAEMRAPVEILTAEAFRGWAEGGGPAGEGMQMNMEMGGGQEESGGHGR